MKYCCVVGCTSGSHHQRTKKKLANGISFYRIPAWKQREGEQISEITKSRRMAWVSAIRRTNITFDSIPESTRVCSLHFHAGKPAYEMQVTHPDWAPSLRLGHKEEKATSPKRCGKQTKKLETATFMVPSQTETTPSYHHHAKATVTPDNEAHIGQSEECEVCKSRQAEINCLLEQHRQLMSELSNREMNEHFLQNNTSVDYYTGLTMQSLMSLSTSVLPFLPQTRKLSSFEMLLLTLIRLRLNFPFEHLAHLFNISRRTASLSFIDTIASLHCRLSALVYWPDREYLQGSMPQQFVEAFGNRAAVILHCFEVVIERPSNPTARVQTYSHNKYGQIQKYVIGVVPQGEVCFISKGWDGNASDKNITENSGLLQKLLPGDVVLVDHGFGLKDGVGFMCAEVKVPACTKGQCQLDAWDVEQMRKVSHLRAHVERVIDCIHNKYKILQETVPVSMALPCAEQNNTFLDKIVTVCCALTNMCASI